MASQNSSTNNSQDDLFRADVNNSAINPKLKSRNWMAVCFNPVKPEGQVWGNTNFRDMKIVIYNRLKVAGLVGKDKPIKYLTHGSEICPTTGTPHLQMFFIFKNDECVSSIVKKMTKWLDCPSCFNWKKADSNVEECIKYCSKDGVEVSSYGDRPKGSGARSDLDAVVDIINSGGSLSDVVTSCPQQFILYSGGIQKLLMFSVKPRSFKTEVYWVYGTTGTGKSRWVFDQMDPESSYFKSAANKWWDGYSGQKDVMIDDFRPSKEMPFDMILRLLDRYPLTVEAKGATMHFTSQRIFITAPSTPRDLFATCEWIGNEQLNQLERRVEHIIHFTSLQQALGYSPALPFNSSGTSTMNNSQTSPSAAQASSSVTAARMTAGFTSTSLTSDTLPAKRSNDSISSDEIDLC